MTKQSQGSMILVGAVAGGVGFVAFVALMVVGEYGVSPAFFLALAVAGAAAVALFIGFHKSDTAKMPEARDRRSLVPSPDGRLGDRTKEPGTAGNVRGLAGVEPGSAGKIQGGTRPSNEAELAPRTGDWRSERPGATAGAVADVENAHANPSAHIARDEAEPNGGSASDHAADARTSNEPAAPVPAKAETVQPATTADEASAQPVTMRDETPAATRNESGVQPGDTTGETSVAPAATMGATPETSASTMGETAARSESTTGETVLGTEPEHLSGPREGGPDDLKRIKGVGPKLEEMLNRMGFYHYDQIAGWSSREVAWVDEHLEGFKGRVSRDDWVDQARILADGGETEFSRRAEET